MMKMHMLLPKDTTVGAYWIELYTGTDSEKRVIREGLYFD